jgi:hypothetical protein
LKGSIGPVKNHLKGVFISVRKDFDREVQKCKRAYWVSLQNELLLDCEHNQEKFWKTIGKIGVGQSKTRGIPLGVIYEDVSITNNISTVLEKCKNDFSSLFVSRQSSVLLYLIMVVKIIALVLV